MAEDHSEKLFDMLGCHNYHYKRKIIPNAYRNHTIINMDIFYGWACFRKIVHYNCNILGYINNINVFKYDTQ